MGDQYVDSHSANKFVRLNYLNFLCAPTVKKIDDTMTSVDFKITEAALLNTGLNFITQAASDYTRISIDNAWVLDAAQLKNGYGYFSGEFLYAVDSATTKGVLYGKYAVPVKINLADYDNITGLGNSAKILQVIMCFYNDHIVPCK